MYDFVVTLGFISLIMYVWFCFVLKIPCWYLAIHIMSFTLMGRRKKNRMLYMMKLERQKETWWLFFYFYTADTCAPSSSVAWNGRKNRKEKNNSIIYDLYMVNCDRAIFEFVCLSTFVYVPVSSVFGW